uniref:Uncharacterized protein n=1 Tax=Rhizophora mucronata TaxID=61149 RepID=A0A2P2N9M3_RHIMU
MGSTEIRSHNTRSPPSLPDMGL